MRKLFSFFLLFSFSINIFSQTLDKSTKNSTKNTVFVSVLGNSMLLASLNYERIFISKKNYQLTTRVGGSYYFHVKNSVIPWSIPMSITNAFGNKHHFQLGIGLTYIYGSIYCKDCSNELSKATASQALYTSFLIGYKYKKDDGHFFTDVGLTPLFRIKEYNSKTPKYLGESYSAMRMRILVGASIGYSF